MLLLSHFVAQYELKPFSLQDVLVGAEKVLKKLTIEVKSPVKLAGVKFFKVRIGSKTKGRMIVFMIVESGQVIPILIRFKKDKIFGINMTMNNPRVVKQIKHNLDRVLGDIKHGRYEEF